MEARVGKTNACHECVHYSPPFRGFEDTYTEPPDCYKRPSMANLNSFPFLRTSCQMFKAREVPLTNIRRAKPWEIPL